MLHPGIQNIPHFVRQVCLVWSTSISRRVCPLLPNGARGKLIIHLLFHLVRFVHEPHQVFTHDAVDLCVVPTAGEKFVIWNFLDQGDVGGDEPGETKRGLARLGYLLASSTPCTPAYIPLKSEAIPTWFRPTIKAICSMRSAARDTFAASGVGPMNTGWNTDGRGV